MESSLSNRKRYIYVRWHCRHGWSIHFSSQARLRERKSKDIQFFFTNYSVFLNYYRVLTIFGWNAKQWQRVTSTQFALHVTMFFNDNQCPVCCLVIDNFKKNYSRWRNKSHAKNLKSKKKNKKILVIIIIIICNLLCITFSNFSGSRYE